MPRGRYLCWDLSASAASSTSRDPRGGQRIFGNRGLERQGRHHEPRKEAVCGGLRGERHHKRLSRLLQDLHNHHNTHWLVAFHYFAGVASATEDQRGLPLRDYKETMFLKTNTVLKTRDIYIFFN